MAIFPRRAQAGRFYLPFTAQVWTMAGCAGIFINSGEGRITAQGSSARQETRTQLWQDCHPGYILGQEVHRKRPGKDFTMLNPRTASRTALERAYLAGMADKVTVHELPKVAAKAAAMPIGELRGSALIRQAQQGCAPAQRLQVIQDLLAAGQLQVVGKGRGARYHLAG